MVATDAPSKHQPVGPPALMVRSADAARLAGVTRPAVGYAVRHGRLRPVAMLLPGRRGSRLVPLFAHHDVIAWAERRLKEAA